MIVHGSPEYKKSSQPPSLPLHLSITALIRFSNIPEMFNVSPTLNLPAPRYTVHMLQHGGKKTTVRSLAGEHLGAVTLAAAYIYSTQSCWPWSC